MTIQRPTVRLAARFAAIIAIFAFDVPPIGAAEALPPDGWRLLKIPGKTVSRFAEEIDGAIEVSATDSVGFLYRDAATIPGSGSYLTWRWRVDVTPPPTDLAMKGMDDRPLALHVWFENEEGSSAGWDLKMRLGAWLLDQPLPGKMLTYVWGGTEKRGAGLRNPYREKAGYIFVLRPGTSAAGKWFTESVDIAADFERAFGYRPGAPSYIAISADTDDKGGRSMGTVADIAFTNRR